MIALEVNGLKKNYGKKVALEDVSFTVKEGTCFGLLGPNGAGKSTTMKILAGIIDAGEGTVKVLGYDRNKEIDQIRKRIGYVPQAVTLVEKISAQDNLQFFGEMYGIKGAVLKQRISEILEQVGLSDRAKDAINTFSGGMKRRINIACALLHNPKLIILDEPTVGIDPQSRNHIFQMIRELKKNGVTILYSTHYMEEVEALCDELAIIDHGKVIAQGELHQLLDQYGKSAVYLEANLSEEPTSLHAERVIREERGWRIETAEPLMVMKELAERCRNEQIQVKRLEIHRPSLESVFLSLTGTSLRDE